MIEHQITIRKQSAQRDYTKQKFIVLSVLTGMVLLIAVFAPYLVPFDPYEQNLSDALMPPDSVHILGTDRYGRDLFSRVIMGGQTTIFSALFLVFVVTVAGTAVGIFCGYRGGRTDSVLMRISDAFLAFPGMVFAIAVTGVLGGGTMNADRKSVV